MASFGSQFSFSLLLVLVLSPQIQAREGKLFNFFTHFKTIYNVKDPQVLLNKAEAESPSPITAPTPSPITAPTPSPITAPTPAPASAPEHGSITVSGPAPDPGFVDSGEGYGLYGSESDSNQYSPTKETPTTTTTFENELLNEDFTGEKYKTGYPKTKTNFYSNNNNNEVYRNNYNNQEYKNNYNNGYNKNYVDSYSNNYNYNENGYERKREGMSDTRFLENGKYYHHVNTNDDNYNLNNMYESERGSTENEGYYEKRQYPNEFDTMEEYEKQQASLGYTP